MVESGMGRWGCVGDKTRWVRSFGRGWRFLRMTTILRWLNAMMEWRTGSPVLAGCEGVERCHDPSTAPRKLRGTSVGMTDGRKRRSEDRSLPRERRWHKSPRYNGQKNPHT